MIKPIQELIKRLKELDYKYYGYELSSDEAELVISALEYYKKFYLEIYEIFEE